MSSMHTLRARLPEQWSESGSKLLFFPAAERRPAPLRPTLEALRGRLTEVSGERPAAALTLAVRWVVEAQANGEVVVWIQSTEGMLHPPDLVDAGVDLERLVVVRLPDGNAIARAADFLLRTGGVGLAVLDLLTPQTTTRPRHEPPREHSAGLALPWRQRAVGLRAQTVLPQRNGWLNRLLALALAHQAGVVCLTTTTADRPSLASLVGLRLEPRLALGSDGRFALETTVLKDKRAQPHRSYREVCRGPLGLR